jgi:alpha-ketoglutarate-dependent taurine dioxygenase
MRIERLTSNAGTPLHYGVTVHVDSYEEAMSIPKQQLDEWVYKDKLLVIKGMKGINKVQFWDFSNRFGAGGWSESDYDVGKEDRMPIGDGSGRVYAHYSNYGKTASAIGDADMSWHVDIPLWPSHRAPLRSFYSISIPDNRYGITRFADRAWGYRNMTPQEQADAEKWQLLYQSWYEPGRHLTLLPVVAESPFDGEKYLQFTSFSNSSKKYSHYWHGFKIHGWIIGAHRDGVPYNADYVSFLHEKTIQDENIYDLVWDEETFAIWNNVHMIHSRTALNSKQQTKTREFYRMNIFNTWQK